LFGSGVTGQVELTTDQMVVMTSPGRSATPCAGPDIFCMSAFYESAQGRAAQGTVSPFCLLTGALMFYLCWHAWDYVSNMQKALAHLPRRWNYSLWIP